MLKLFKIVFWAILLVSSSYAAQKISDKEIKQIEKLSLFKNAQIKVLEGYDMQSVYLLKISARGNHDNVFLTKDKKYIVVGDMLSTNDGKKLTLPVDLKVLKGKEAFTFGKGQDEYILFTDPECPYCKKFESYFTQIEDKVKIRIFFFPLSFHSNARDLSLYIMAQDSYDKKVDAMLNTDKNTPAFKNRKIEKNKLTKLEKKLDENIEIGVSLGVRGTPTLLDSKGNKISWVEMLSEYGVKVK